MGDLEVSIVVAAFDMARELPRTISSLSASSQVGIAAQTYEIIVVDNGSPDPVTFEPPTDGTNLILRRESTPSVSPARAINRAIESCRGDLIGVIVDGARIASPGLLRWASAASRLDERAVISPLAWHLGPNRHSDAAAAGYDQRVEDELLASIGWPADPYRLFEVSTLAASSGRGWFGPLGESSSVFMRRPLWDELGGYDVCFESPGGGYMNHDLYRRACNAPASVPIMIVGEGTFHQIHGGAATSDSDAPTRMRHEYEVIRGHRYRPPTSPVTLLGHMPREAIVHLEASSLWAAQNPERVSGSFSAG